MKLLVVTQTVDAGNPVLGFFARWIGECAKHVERIEVICLSEGAHTLPDNVHVHSLGKEHGASSRAAYSWRFLLLAWRLRREYDAVFVHMNQEYILIAGWLWKLLGKRVYMWRNHYAGSLLTDIAMMWCTKIFCTSKHSYTAKYKKTVIMPVGVDTERFTTPMNATRKPRSILFLARMSPSKRPEMLIDALATLAREHSDFVADFYGSPLPQDESYYESLKERVRTLGITRHISFYTGVSNDQTPELYRTHEIFVNTSPSGMLDKTIFEAVACGCIVLASSADFSEIAGTNSYFDTAIDLAERLKEALALDEGARVARQRELQEKAIDAHTLPVLARRLAEEMQGK